MRSTAARKAWSGTASAGDRCTKLEHGIDRALAQAAAAEIDAGQAGRGGEGDEVRAFWRRSPAPVTPYFSLASATIERPSGVSSARLASSAASASFALRDAGHRDELGRHAVAEGDGAGLVEQQRVDVARRLHRAAGRGDAH